MSQRVYLNNFKTTLAADINAGDTSIPVVSLAVALSQYPVLTNGQYFLVTLDDGVKYEIVQVGGLSGNSLTACIRGQEGTLAVQFTQGTRVEARVTAGTLSAFARLVDRMADATEVATLPAASAADANSYLTGSLDDAGNPIFAVKYLTKWRFPTHPTIASSGSLASSGSTTSISVASTSYILSAAMPGGYILQFTSGANAGLCRRLTSYTSNSISWATALPSAPSAGDTYEVYQSVAASLGTISSLQDDSIAIALIFAD